MFSASENDAQERLLRTPLNPQQTAMGNSGNPGSVRQQQPHGLSGSTPPPNLSTPSTYWQK